MNLKSIIFPCFVRKCYKNLNIKDPADYICGIAIILGIVLILIPFIKNLQYYEFFHYTMPPGYTLEVNDSGWWRPLDKSGNTLPRGFSGSTGSRYSALRRAWCHYNYELRQIANDTWHKEGERKR